MIIHSCDLHWDQTGRIIFTGAQLCSDHTRSVRDNQICGDGGPGAILGAYARKNTHKNKEKL